MKTNFSTFLTAALAAFLPTAIIHAAELTNAGVLGNSGEQGPSLVHFGDKQVQGIGVVLDKYGTLWDRGGQDTLNRYALDGRLIASYPIEASNAGSDKITLLGNKILLLLNRKLFSISIDAPAGTKPDSLGLGADSISFGAVGDKIAVVQDQKLLLLDVLTKTTEPVAPDVLPNVRDVELRPDGSVIATFDGMEHLFKDGHEVTEGWPRAGIGDRLQFIDNVWYAIAGHGTIRRFNADLEAAPGVVLGGGSGSFIGHVDELSELELPRGMAKIDATTFAVSGLYGVIHLIHWNEEKRQFEVVRRIGALQTCGGIALSRQGDIWVHGAMWKWNDGPETPQQNGTPIYEIGQASMLPSDSFIAACNRNGPSLLAGNFTWKVISTPVPDLPKDMLQGSVVYQTPSRQQVLLLVGAGGLAHSFQIDSTGQLQKDLGPVTLHTNPPVIKWTSLAQEDNDHLLAGADGAVLELKRDGAGWTESARWNRWDPAPDSVFGKEIYLSADSGHLWISDTDRQRVFCFSLQTEKPLATFGVVDKEGNDMAHVQSPRVIIGRGNKAIFFDSGNQRLIKLLLSE